MTEAKPKRTLSKLGRLFGVSSTNLTQLPADPAAKPTSPVTLDSLSQSAKEKSRAKSPPPQNTVPAVSEVSESTEEDVLAPLPNDRSATASPMLPAAPNMAASAADAARVPSGQVSAQETASSARSRSPSVSRSSSMNGYAKKSTKTQKGASAKTGTGSPSTLSPSVSSTHLPTAAPVKPRFYMYEDGSHGHNLRAAKRQEKLSNMLKDLMGAKKLRDGAKSAVPNILSGNKAEAAEPPTLFAGLVNQVKNNTSPYHAQGEDLVPKQDSRSFVEKYGRCQEVIGSGSFGVVRISHKKALSPENGQEEMLYAVKEFKRRPNESEKKYSRRLTSEFCISSSLKHPNIIDTLDLLKDAKGDYCEVMEFCSGGDLYTLIIAAGKLEYAEADCFFKQLIRGVNYMHDMGVSHRDLKPENLLLTQQGVLKITDFGNGECFKMAWEDEIHFSDGVCGSSPYIAPEEFTQDQFDSRCVDIWACGVIYMAMRTGRQLWKLADAKRDDFFEEYLVQRKDATGYEPIESLKRARCRNVIYSILDPIPERRITGKQILNSEWGREIRVCAAGEHRDENAVPAEPVSEKLQKLIS